MGTLAESGGGRSQAGGGRRLTGAPTLGLAAAVAGATILILAAGASSAAGPTLYVDQASIGGRCSDSRTVTQAANPATPWCTLTRAFAAAPAASTVVVRAATYPRVIVKNFHRSAQVSFVAQGGERPLLKDVIVDHSDHIEFRGLRINRVYATYSSNLRFVANEVTVGGLWARYSDHLTYENNNVHDTNGTGIVVYDSTDIDVRGNKFEAIPATSRVGGDGLQAGNVKRMLISGNLFQRLRAIEHGDAIEIVYSNEDVTIERNRFVDCRPLITAPTTSRPVTNARWLIQNNVFTRTREWAMRLLNMDGARIINNTAWDTQKFGIELKGRTVRTVLLNNITPRLDAQPTMIATEDYNLIAAGYRKGAHDLAGPPRFVNPASLDYRLRSGSPGIDAGTSDGAPARDFDGKPRVDAPGVPNTGGGAQRFFDIGAYEFQG